MEKTLKWYANVLAGILGFAVPTYFAWVLYQTSAPQTIATWGMVLLLDVLGLVLTIRDGHTRPLLQIGWVVAAVCIFTSALVSKAPLYWGWVETVCVLLCVFAVYLWLSEERKGEKKNLRKALWMFMVAFYFSFGPLVVDYWANPQPATVWLWEWTIATCLLSIYAMEKRDFTHTFVPWGGIGINCIITILCFL